LGVLERERGISSLIDLSLWLCYCSNGWVLVEVVVYGDVDERDYVNVVNVDVVDFCVVAEFSQPTSGNMTRAGATAGRAGRN